MTTKKSEAIRLKDFAARIKFESPDVQHDLLKQYLTSVALDQFSGSFKLIFQIRLPSDSSSDPLKVLEKTVYFSPE